MHYPAFFSRACDLVLLASALSISPAYAQNYGFSVAVDGQHVAGDLPSASSAQSPDVASTATDIQVRYVGAEIGPVFNLFPVKTRTAYRAGEQVDLFLRVNYPAFVARAEVIITDSHGVSITLPAATNSTVEWIMPDEGAGTYQVVGRIYDAQGRYDESAPFELYRVSGQAPGAFSSDTAFYSQGEDRAAKRSIPLSGGAVTVLGSSVQPGSSLSVLGEHVPLRAGGTFAIDRILPAGQHDIEIVVARPDGEVMKSRHSVTIPDEDWFFVALADLTVGARAIADHIEPGPEGEFSETFTSSQLQFYLKGKIRGEYLLTAAGDSGEGPIEDMFQGMLSDDPRSVLSRIDPNEFYAVYGDDSELVEDAPTRGKLFVRLERGESKVMWGMFRTEISNSAFYRDTRLLYGGAATYKSEDTTSSSDPRLSVNLHAADPGTLPQRDILRGSGGSAYFLHRRDIVPWSETLTVEVRDGVSGMVRSRLSLVQGRDYRINYMQGLIILNAPLSALATSGSVSSTVADAQYLVVEYEFTPSGPEVDGYTLAGAGQTWLGDHVSVGATVVRESISGQETTLVGVNCRVQLDEDTFIAAEVMRSEGQGTSSWVSIDGGLTFVEASVAARVDPAYAVRVAAEADLAHLGLKGAVGSSVEFREAGFAASGSANLYDQFLLDSFARVSLSPQAELELLASAKQSAGHDHTRRYSADLTYALTPEFTVKVGMAHLDIESSDLIGQRTDAGIGVEYRLNENLEVSAFARKTLAYSGNLANADRVGIGAEYRINDAVTLEGELSYGTLGLGGMIGIVHQPSGQERNYLGYRVDADADVGRVAAARTGFVVGTERRIAEAVAINSEAVYNTFDRNNTLTQSYAITLTPDQLWTISGALERGKIIDPHGEDFERTALSLLADYSADGLAAKVRGELRQELADTGAEYERSILFGSSVSWTTSDEWRLLANFDGVVSQHSQLPLLNGDFVEASVGYAYRPVDNERFNALMRYTFLYDVPVLRADASGSASGPAQRSHIFTVDANYDVTDFMTVGAKYGYRVGEISETRDAADFLGSSAHLGIVRIDAEVVKDWSVLAEGRALYLPEAEAIEVGALAAVYYNINENVRAGVGYNFTDFSSDLRVVDRSERGAFFNVLAKF